MSNIPSSGTTKQHLNQSSQKKEFLDTQENDKFPHYQHPYKIIDQTVWDDPNLSSWEILLYGLFNSLRRKEGYAFASNKALVSMMPKGAFKHASSLESKVRLIKRWISKLEKNGHIFVETKRNGFYWDRKIYTSMSPQFSKKVYQVTVESPRGDCRVPWKGTVESLVEEHKYNNIKEERGRPPAPPPSHSSSSLNSKKLYEVTVELPRSSSLISFGKEFGIVKLTQQDYDTLAKRYGKETLDRYIQELDAYLASNGKTKKCYKAALINWHSKEQKYTKRKHTSKDEEAKKNYETATKCIRKLTTKLHELNKKTPFKFHVTGKYVEIALKDSPHSRIINYYDNNFSQTLEKELRKMKLYHLLD